MKEMTKSLPVSKRMVYNSYLKVCDNSKLFFICSIIKVMRKKYTKYN